MKKLLSLCSLLFCLSCHAQVPSHIFTVIPYAGGQGRVDFQDPTGAFTVHVQAATALASNNIFAFPINTVTTASAGYCLTLLSTSTGTTEWDTCGGAGITPPVTWSITNANPVLTLSNGGTGANSDGLRTSANGPGYAINVTAGDSTMAGSLKFTGAAHGIIINGTGGVTVQGGGGIDVNTGDLTVQNGHFFFGSSLLWEIDPHYVVPGLVNYFDILNPGATSMMRFDAAASKVSVPSGQTFQVDGTLAIPAAGAVTVGAAATVTGGSWTIGTTTHFITNSTTFDQPILADGDIFIRGPASSYRGLEIHTKATLTDHIRWDIEANADAESGSNNGSNFIIERYSDAGGFIDTPLTISRATGAMLLPDPVTLDGVISGAHGQNFGVADSPSVASITVNGVATTARSLFFTTSGSSRWQLDAVGAESGTAVGSDLFLGRYNNSGGLIDTPITITRSTGLTTFADAVTHSSTTTLNGTVNGTHGQNIGTSDSPQFAIGTFTSGISAFGITVTSNGIAVTGASTITTSTGQALNVSTSGNAFSMFFSDTGGTCRMGFASGGVTCPSDVRLKTNINSMPSVLDRIMQLRPVTFNWRQSGETTDGLIAQDVQKVFPLVVHSGQGDAGPDTLHISYMQLVPYLIKSIQEMKLEIDALKKLRK